MFLNILKKILNKNAFVINIGNEGTILSLEKNGKLDKKIFIDKLSDSNIGAVRSLFNKNPKSPIYILLDTIEQNYNHRTFPAVNRFDLHNLVKRKLKQGAPDSYLKGKYLLGRDERDQKWNYVFISAPITPLLQEWLDLFYSVNNRFMGFYMLPIELQTLVKNLYVKKDNVKVVAKKADKSKSKSKSKDEWTLLITQNKTNGMREVAFKDGTLVFTRLLSNSVNNENFLQKFEKDIYNTFEYLKRLSPDKEIEFFNIITITQESAKNGLQTLKFPEFSLEHLTPYEAAVRIEVDNVVNAGDKFCDILIRSNFIKGKKLIRFLTDKGKKLDLLFLIRRSSFYGSIFMAGISTIAMIFLLYSWRSNSSRVAKLEKTLVIESDTFQDKNLKKFQIEGDIEELIDIGSVADIIENKIKNPVEILERFKKVQKDLAVTNAIDWFLEDYNFDKSASNANFVVRFTADLINEGGDIENLFSIFDEFTMRVEKEFKNYNVIYSKLPANINFSQKYYRFPLAVEIRSGKMPLANNKNR